MYLKFTQRINNKDAHRFNDSGAPRLGNVWVYGREAWKYNIGMSVML